MCCATYEARNRKRRWDKIEPVKKEPPCGKCRPGLHPDNALAVEIYNRCSDQWRFSEVTGMLTIDNSNIQVVLAAMRIDRQVRLDLLDDVKLIVGEIANLINQERDK
ncbi:MAG: DUF1799 domain-containing protein [Desulforhopalus sp.]